MNSSIITPNWPVSSKVKAFSTTRSGGASSPPYDSLNLGNHVGDAPELVQKNRVLLQKKLLLPDPLVWLTQKHTTLAVNLNEAFTTDEPIADAAWTRLHDRVCLVMTADCLPVLLCNTEETQVAAVHAGWRGLCDGVLQSTIKNFKEPSSVMAWLGPCIGLDAFEVGDEVRQAFLQKNPAYDDGFQFVPDTQKYHADLKALAQIALNQVGVTKIYSDSSCTFSDRMNFFSFRRDKTTGRMATGIYLGS